MQVDNDATILLRLHFIKIERKFVTYLKKKLGYENSDDPYEMTKFVRKQLREKFMDAEIGVTGCNFAVANTGSLCLVTNEGNADLVMSIPKHKLQ